MSDAYAAAGVDTNVTDSALAGLVDVLRAITLDRPSLSVLPSGHYANVLEVAPNLGVALSTDGVGSKIVVAEQTGRYDTVGIDCIAMNVNDVICVGARPLAVLDYLAVETADAQMLHDLAIGLKAGAEQADVEIPGGELAVVPELIRGHPSPRGFDLAASCFGTVALDRIVTGSACEPGDVLIGLPSSGVHSNGLTLARRALLQDGGLSFEDTPSELGGATVADALLEPTAIYVRAVMELLESDVDVRGLAHITGGGLTNLLRLEAPVGFQIDAPLPVSPVFELIAHHGRVSTPEMWEVFNMGCGFCAVVAARHADRAVSLLGAHHPGAAVIGSVTDRSDWVTVPGAGLAGGPGGLVSA